MLDSKHHVYGYWHTLAVYKVHDLSIWDFRQININKKNMKNVDCKYKTLYIIFKIFVSVLPWIQRMLPQNIC